MKADHSLSRTVAALVGTIPVALAVGMALTLALPLAIDERYLIGVFSVFPAWVGASCVTFLARSGARAWLLLCCIGLAAVLMAVVAIALGHRLV